MKSLQDIAAFVASQDEKKGPAISGRWHNLQLKPDLGSGELLNFGVAFVDDGNRVHLKVARDLSRLTCFYDDRVDVPSFEHLCSLIADGFNGARLEDFCLSQLSVHAQLSEGRYASGASIGEILNGFYEATVPIGRPRIGQAPNAVARARTISTPAAREEVINRLLHRMGQRALPFIARDPWIVRDEAGVERKIDIPIRAPGRLSAAVISLWSKATYNRKFQLMKAGLDLDTIKTHAVNERLGLFVMRPMGGEGYSRSDLQDIDGEIDEAAWQLRKVARIEVEQAPDAESLSGLLETWLEVA